MRIDQIKARVPMSMLLMKLGADFPDWASKYPNPLGGVEPFRSVTCPFHDDDPANPSGRYLDDSGTGSGYFKCHSCGVEGDQITILVDGLEEVKKVRDAVGWLVKRFGLSERKKPRIPKVPTAPKRPPDWEPPLGWCETDRWTESGWVPTDEPTDHDWEKPWKDTWGHPSDGSWTQDQWDLAIERWRPVALSSIPRTALRTLLSLKDEVDQLMRAATAKALVAYDPDRSDTASFSTFLRRVIHNKALDLVKREKRRRAHELRDVDRAPLDNEKVRTHHRARQAREPLPEDEWAAGMDWSYALTIIELRLDREHARMMWHLGTTGFGKKRTEGWTLREYAKDQGISLTKAHRLHREILDCLKAERVIGREITALRDVILEAKRLLPPR